MNYSGHMLKDKRLEKGMSLRYLSQLSGVSHTEISKIEKGERENPNRNVLIKLANALDVDTNKFLGAFGYISDELMDISSDNIEKYENYIKKLKNINGDKSIIQSLIGSGKTNILMNDIETYYKNETKEDEKTYVNDETSKYNIHHSLKNHTEEIHPKFNIIQANKSIINNIKKEIKYSTGSSVEFDEQYKINNKIAFDFVGFDNDHRVYGCEVKHLSEMLPISINSIKLSFIDFYFHFKSSFKDDEIKFYGVFIIKDENSYTKLESMLRNYFSHLKPIFKYIIYVEKDLCE